MSTADLIEVRRHGGGPATVVVLHGGPGAPGSAAPVAHALSHDFGVLEPLQRWSGEAPLTVARHIEDLQGVIEHHCGGPPHFVGHSWGAMLALAHAAEHPRAVRSLALIGCGTFDPVARGRLRSLREKRTTPEIRAAIAAASERAADENERLGLLAEAMLPIDVRELADPDVDFGECDARGHEETWNDMVRCQEEGTYPAAFHTVACPVKMFHGDYDPHPGSLIRDSLKRLIPQLEYLEWPRCGHYPWFERGDDGSWAADVATWLRGP